MVNEIVLLSGGISSTVLLAHELSRQDANIYCVYYRGLTNNKTREDNQLESVIAIAAHYGLEYVVLDIADDSTLYTGRYLPHYLLIATASYGLARGYQAVAAGVLDSNRWLSYQMTASAMFIGSNWKIRLGTPLVQLSPEKVYQRGVELKAPLSLATYCDDPGVCKGTCPGCKKWIKYLVKE